MSNSSSCDSCGHPHGLWGTDRLTLLLDRWGWDDQAAELLKASPSTALLVVDLDNFKRVNDRFGHVAGDEVLRDVADTLRRVTRKGDLLGRYGGHGGDEFLVLLPGTDTEGALTVAERIRTGIRSMVVTAPTSSGTTSITATTASIGLSVGSPETDLQSLVLQADAALRGAKRTGRDRVRPVERGPRRAFAVRLAVLGVCAAGLVTVFVTGEPRPVPEANALPGSASTSTPLPTVTVPTTVTATTVVSLPAPPPAVRKTPVNTTPAKKKQQQPTPEPSARGLDKPPTTSSKPCPLCDLVGGMVDDAVGGMVSGLVPLLPR
jgi:diguanylate cyclase (GGDEF)-like protein